MLLIWKQFTSSELVKPRSRILAAVTLACWCDFFLFFLGEICSFSYILAKCAGTVVCYLGVDMLCCSWLSDLNRSRVRSLGHQG